MSIVTKLFGVLTYGHRASADSYIKFLKKSGVKIGENFTIFNPRSTMIDVQNPHLLTIGDDVNITGPVTILTHDYSWCVLKKMYGEVVGKQKSVSIGNNVWIGANVTILPGVTIGDDTVIGAGSVVNRDIPSGVVAAGNPCRVIRKITEADKEKYPVYRG